MSLDGLSFEERADAATTLAAKRKAMGLSQSELAQRTGISRQTVSNVERGITTPNPHVLGQLLEGLGMNDPLDQYPADVRAWLIELAPLIETIPPAQRSPIIGGMIQGLRAVTSGMQTAKKTRP